MNQPVGQGAGGETGGAEFRQHRLVKVVRQVLLLVSLAALIGVGANAIRSDGITLIGDWSAGVASVYQESSLVILFEQARERFEDASVLFVDARPDFEYQEGHIAGSLSLPLDQAQTRVFDVIDQLYGRELIITYCDGEGCNLSHDLAVFLQDMGVEEVRVLVNGWTLWREAGLPISRDDT